jgi:hypothetical protein
VGASLQRPSPTAPASHASLHAGTPYRRVRVQVLFLLPGS